MFTLDATIDAVQTGKKTFVNTFVQNEKAKTAMIDFIEAQAEYTKKASKVGMDTFTTLTSEAVKMVQEAAKIDYTKFGEGFGKAWTSATQTASKK
jgi:hypothetical protein